MATSDSSGGIGHRTDPERLLCPQHHHDCWDQRGPTVYCKSCGHSYRYQDCIDPVHSDAGAPGSQSGADRRTGRSSSEMPR